MDISDQNLMYTGSCKLDTQWTTQNLVFAFIATHFFHLATLSLITVSRPDERKWKLVLKMISLGKCLSNQLNEFLGNTPKPPPSPPEPLPPGRADPKGWGDGIEWMTLPEGFAKARNENKTIFVLIHKMTCAACMRHKQWFSRSQKIRELSKEFVMINLEIHQIPRNPDFFPDGNYVPRILFFSPQGRLIPDARYPFGNQEYKYSYNGSSEVVQTMKTWKRK